MNLRRVQLYENFMKSYNNGFSNKKSIIQDIIHVLIENNIEKLKDIVKNLDTELWPEYFNSQDKNVPDLLSYAYTNKNIGMIKFLFSEGIECHQSVIFYTIINKNIPFFDLFMEYSPDMSRKKEIYDKELFKSLGTPLWSTIKFQNFYMFSSILNTNVYIESRYNPDSKTALHACSIYDKNTKYAKALINKGINIQLADKYKDTPLHTAIQYNNVQMIDFLIQNNATIDNKNSDNETELELSERKRINLNDMLLKSKINITSSIIEDSYIF